MGFNSVLIDLWDGCAESSRVGVHYVVTLRVREERVELRGERGKVRETGGFNSCFVVILETGIRCVSDRD